MPERATTPWLGGIGLTVTGILFALAAVASTAFEIKQDHFVASKSQFLVAAVVCVVAVVGAFRLPNRSAARTTGWVPNPWLVGAATMIAGSIFLVVPNVWGWLAVGLYVLMDLMLIAAVSALSNRAGWNGQHRLALAGGAALAYAWHAFLEHPAVGNGGTSFRIGNAVFAAALIVLLVIAARRTASQSNTSHAIVMNS